MGEAFGIAGLEGHAQGREVRFELRGPGGPHPVFFRGSEPVLEVGPEFLLACALLPAMREGAELDLAGPVSARLLSALPTIVDILAAWAPELSPVSLPKLVPVSRERTSRGRVGSFFSGGVDSFYTFLKNRDEITDLVFVEGFDVPAEDADLLRSVARSIDEIAQDLGVGVVHVETNLKEVIKAYVGWGNPGHGPGLMAVGHLLAPAFERIYVPSSFRYADLFPWGTHPLLDPLWSSEQLEFVHDGCEATRVAKLELVAGLEAALRGLRVCNKLGRRPYNCGECEKCIRTMIGLEAVGKLGQCTAFEAPLDPRGISRLRVTQVSRPFFLENLQGLRERGVRPDLQRAIERRLRRPAWMDRAGRVKTRAERFFHRRILLQKGWKRDLP